MCLVQDDNSMCVCPKCEGVYTPVCGTDGLSYASNCYLKQAACKLRRNVIFGKNGACGMYCSRFFMGALGQYFNYCYCILE